MLNCSHIFLFCFNASQWTTGIYYFAQFGDHFARSGDIANFNKERAFYTFLPRCILVICRFLRPIWLLSTIPLTSLFSFVLTFCLSVCIQFVYSIVATCTGHYPVLLGAVCVTGTEPCKEVESVSECTVNGRIHAI